MEDNEIEIIPDALQLPACDLSKVDNCRKTVYLSYQQWLLDRLTDSDSTRKSAWKRDYSSSVVYEKSIVPYRSEFKKMLGFWSEPESRPEVDIICEETIHEQEEFVAKRVHFEAVPGLRTYCLELIPKRVYSAPGLIVQHGYADTPELVCGYCKGSNLKDYSSRSLGLRAVLRNYYVVAVCHPYGYGDLEERSGSLPDQVHLGFNYGKNRLHRLACLAGGTAFGLDLLATSRGIDLLIKRGCTTKVGIYGLSQGGQTALYLPALDTRISASVCSAYFNQRFFKLVQSQSGLSYLDSCEEDKFFNKTISLFSDSDIVSLIAPRAFAIEAGRKDLSVLFKHSLSEYEQAKTHFEKLGVADRIEFIAHEEGHISATKKAFEFLDRHLK